MLIELLARFFLGIFESIFSALPTVNVTLPSGTVGTLSSIIASVAYFIPVGLIANLIMVMFSIDIGIFVYRFVIRIIRFVPFIG